MTTLVVRSERKIWVGSTVNVAAAPREGEAAPSAQTAAKARARRDRDRKKSREAGR
jgi:hypothetical protein